jgi:hypothetical protein
MTRTLVGMALLLVGCGGGSDVNAFVGSWTSNGTQVEDCPSGSHSDTGSLAVNIIAAPTAATITTQPNNGCNLNWTVSGKIATLAGTQTCAAVPGSVGGTWTATFTTGTLTLSGGTVAVADSGTAVYVNGFSQNCTFTQSGTYTKN